MRTIDMRRRKSPITIARIIHLNNRWRERTGHSADRLLLRLDQQAELYELLQKQVRFRAGEIPADSRLWWLVGLKVVAR